MESIFCFKKKNGSFLQQMAFPMNIHFCSHFLQFNVDAWDQVVLCLNMCMNCTPLFEAFGFLCFLKILFKIWIYAIAILAARNNKCPISGFKVLFNSTNTSKHMLQTCQNRKIFNSFLANKQTDTKCIRITQKTNRKATFSVNKATCPPIGGRWNWSKVNIRYLRNTSP